MIKKFLLLFVFAGLLNACGSDDDKQQQAPLAAAEYANVQYGTDSQQTMDVYLPAGRTADTKVIILIHGGAWISGSKEDFADFIPVIKEEFPDDAIVNINYRLATETSPAFPKQMYDLQKVIAFLKDSDYVIDNTYALIGASAGAHLAMLYGYEYDTTHEVKVICDIVGPADFLDPEYSSNPVYPFAAQYLVGTPTPTPQLIETVSPLAHITAQAPPTLSFYGGADPLIPATQGPRLKAELDEAGVVNEFNFYATGGHGDWDDATFDDVYTKLISFFEAHFE